MRFLRRAPGFLRKKHFTLLGEFHEAYQLAKKLKKEEKALHRYQKRIKKFNERLIDRLRKLSEKGAQEKFNKKVTKAGREFYECGDSLMASYITVFTKLNAIVTLLERAEYTDLKSSTDILQNVVRTDQKLIFTDSNIHDFESGFHKFERQMLKDIRLSVDNDKRMSAHDKPKHMGYLRVHKSNNGLIGDLKKADKILSKQNQMLTDVLALIERDTQGGVKQEFLDHVDFYITQFSHVELTLKRLKDDIRELIFHHITEHNKECRDFVLFSSFIRNHVKPSAGFTEKVETFYGVEKDNPLFKQSEDWANKELKSEQSFYYFVRQLHYLWKTLGDRLHSDKEALLQKVG